MADGSVKIDITAEDNDVKKKLDGVGDAAEDAADGVDKLGDSTKDAEGGLDALDVAMGNLLSNGLSALISGLGDAVQSLFSLADETREFREDMAKLDTAFTTTGHTTEEAKNAYNDFYAILGESDRSVEAVNHLAELTNNEQELAQWSTIAAGVTAKFGDSLPLEGLTEAANETAKVGQTTGVLADALNWASADSAAFKDALGGNNKALAAFNKAIKDGENVEDAFTAALGQMSTEQERSAAITNTLNGIYADAAKEYNELTGSAQDARRAQAEMEETQAALGAAVEPLTTALTRLKTDALQALQPVVETVVQKLQEFQQWLEENPGKAEVLKAVIVGIATALGVLAVALGISNLIQLVTTAFAVLNTTMLANPIVLIVAAIAGLVAAFILLWNNCESFRNFFIGLWETIKPPIMTFIEYLKGLFQAAWDWIKGVWEAVQPFFAEKWEQIKAVFSVVVEVLGEFFSSAWNVIQNIWNVVAPYFQTVWENIKITFSVVASILGNFFSLAWTAIQNVWNVVVAYFQVVWAGIQAVFSVVTTWFQGMFAAAWAAIQAVWNAVTGYFKAIWETIKGIFAVVKAVLSGNWSDAWAAIKGIVGTWASYFSSVWASIKNVFAAVKSWFTSTFSAAVAGIKSVWSSITNYFSTIWQSIKNIFSDAKSKFLSIGSDIVAGIKSGISNAWSNLVSWFTGLFGDLKSIAKKILGINSPSKEFAWIGQMMMLGLRKGIADYRKEAISDLQKLCQDMIKVMEDGATDEVKVLETKLDEMEKLYKQEQKDYDEQIEKLNKSKTKNNKAAIEEKVDTLKKEKELHKEQYETQKEAVKEELSLAKEREKSITTFAKNFEKQLKEFTAIEQDYVDGVKKINEQLVKDVQAAQQKYDDAFANRVNAIKNDLGLFEMAEKSYPGSSAHLTRALESQIDVLNEYNAELDTLNSKGLRQDFVDEIMGMGIDAMSELKAINRMSDKELEKYVALWEEKNRLAAEAATDELATMREDTAKEIELLNIQAEKDLETLKGAYTNAMVALVGEIGKGMTEAGEAGLASLGALLTQYSQIGENMMDGIVDGIEYKSSAVLEAMVNNVTAAIVAAKEAAGIHSPSTVMRDEVGENLALGMIQGWHNRVAEMRKVMTGDVAAVTASVRATVGAENARYGATNGRADTGFTDLARAVGIQTAGINSLAGEYKRGSSNMRPIIIQLDKRELGRAVVDVSNAENVRVGAKFAYGGVR